MAEESAALRARFEESLAALTEAQRRAFEQDMLALKPSVPSHASQDGEAWTAQRMVVKQMTMEAFSSPRHARRGSDDDDDMNAARHALPLTPAQEPSQHARGASLRASTAARRAQHEPRLHHSPAGHTSSQHTLPGMSPARHAASTARSQHETSLLSPVSDLSTSHASLDSPSSATIAAAIVAAARRAHVGDATALQCRADELKASLRRLRASAQQGRGRGTGQRGASQRGAARVTFSDPQDSLELTAEEELAPPAAATVPRASSPPARAEVLVLTPSSSSSSSAPQRGRARRMDYDCAVAAVASAPRAAVAAVDSDDDENARQGESAGSVGEEEDGEEERRVLRILRIQQEGWSASSRVKPRDVLRRRSKSRSAEEGVSPASVAPERVVERRDSPPIIPAAPGMTDQFAEAITDLMRYNALRKARGESGVEFVGGATRVAPPVVDTAPAAMSAPHAPIFDTNGAAATSSLDAAVVEVHAAVRAAAVSEEAQSTVDAAVETEVSPQLHAPVQQHDVECQTEEALQEVPAEGAVIVERMPASVVQGPPATASDACAPHVDTAADVTADGDAHALASSASGLAASEVSTAPADAVDVAAMLAEMHDLLELRAATLRRSGEQEVHPSVQNSHPAEDEIDDVLATLSVISDDLPSLVATAAHTQRPSSHKLWAAPTLLPVTAIHASFDAASLVRAAAVDDDDRWLLGDAGDFVDDGYVPWPHTAGRQAERVAARLRQRGDGKPPWRP